MHYINLTSGVEPATAATLSQPMSVQAFIGTPPMWRRRSRLCWRQGPCISFEEMATAALATTLYRLGPHYLGSLQAPQMATTGEVLPSQVAEERVLFGLNAVACSPMTLAKIRRVYARIDNRAIAKQLAMPPGENATLIQVLHNSAGHLPGPARSLGGVIIG